MKVVILTMACGISVWMASAAELKMPAFRMTEPELLAVLKENGLNDKVTACQELSHVGSSAAVPALAAHLTDTADPALFLAVRYALENIPGAEAEAALKKALSVVTDAKRRGGIEKSLRARTTPIPDGYVGASEKLTAFPPKTAVQKGDLSVVPALVETALGTGPEATRMMVPDRRSAFGNFFSRASSCGRSPASHSVANALNVSMRSPAFFVVCANANSLGSAVRTRRSPRTSSASRAFFTSASSNIPTSTSTMPSFGKPTRWRRASVASGPVPSAVSTSAGTTERSPFWTAVFGGNAVNFSLAPA